MNVLLTKELNISFKGQRNYVYASDVFIEVLNVLSEKFVLKNLRKIDFSTHKMAHHQLLLNLYDEQPREVENMQSMFNFEFEGKIYFGVLSETGNEIVNRTEYDEKSLFKSFEIDLLDKKVIFTKKSNYSFMDIYTSLNKHLLTNMFPEIEQGWLSVRAKLDKISEGDYEELKVVFKKDFAGRYFQSNMYFNNEQIGQIFFSPKQQ